MQKNKNLLIGGLKVVRSGAGYRPAVDPYFLCSFAEVCEDDFVVEFGSAAGIVPLLLSATSAANKIIGIEIQPQLVAQAKRNVELNNLQHRIEIINADIRQLTVKKILPHESCDVVLTNPPYRKHGAGKVAPDDERAACRHEIHGDIRDFIDAAFYLLRNKGRFSLIYLPERLPELLNAMSERKIEPKRLRCVHSRVGSGAVMVLVEGRKNGRPGMKVEPPLYIYDGDEYSREVKDIFEME